uniref:LRRGT00016 n=1 Tax=Rattus norvegicus TaxID=10116 RepID=Q6TXI3_RAT|nr:LRRGT00016 [Rattus norvegicus]|eukprot:NP_001028861.1 lon protease homolog 2, peroxisomal [Rattus norvegicus]
MSSVNPIQIPSRLPLLLTHESVLLPGSTMRTSVDTARNLQLVRSRLLKGTSLQSTILGVIPNTPDPASDSQDLPPLHRPICVDCFAPCSLGSRASLDCTVTVDIEHLKCVCSNTSFNTGMHVLLRAVQMMEAWLMEIQRRAKTQLGLLRVESGIWSAGNEELAATNKRTEPLRLKPLLCWDNGSGERAGESAVIKNKPASLRIGTAALAVQVVGSNWPKPHYTLLITGLCRFQIVQVLKEKPYPVAEVEQLDRLEEFPNTCKTREELGELSEQFYRYSVQLVEMLDMSVPAVAKLRRLLDSLPREALPDILTSIIRTSNKEKLQILDAVSLEDRFKMTIPLLVRQIEGLKLLQKTRKPKQDDDKRVIAIRPIRRITHIPGALEDEEEEEDNDDIVMLEKKIRTSSMPEQAHKVCVKEIKRLKKMPQSMPEYALTRNYLELMVELPWNKSTTDRLDIRAARILLDNDHYAMEKLKRRVLEYLAVRQLKNNLKGPILCFVGPPGVGKTSVGRSVAKTLGREFHRIALGGVCDQSDIRGHRRTYVGSMPGRIINGLKTVGVNNPVFLLDEVDKLGKSLQGDPAAALLEVLDPEQNHNFTDHYLNVAFDLSQVLFIATANTTATIPPALLDRMEIIQVPGYTQEEKIEIAHRHLIPKQLEQHGLTPQQIQIPQLTTLAIITRYTREAGVRSLDRKFGAICRAVAVKVAEGQHKEAKLDRSDVADGEEPAASILGLRAALESRQTTLIPVHEEASDSRGSGCAPLVNLTTNGSVLAVPEMTIMSLFQKVLRTNLLCSAPLTLPIFPDKSPI